MRGIVVYCFLEAGDVKADAAEGLKNLDRRGRATMLSSDERNMATMSTRRATTKRLIVVGIDDRSLLWESFFPGFERLIIDPTCRYFAICYSCTVVDYRCLM